MDKGDLFKALGVLVIGYLYVDFVKHEERPLVETENGFVRGIISYSSEYRQRYKAFMGIPYAKPPLGSLRFEHPQKPENWTGTLNTDHYRSQCKALDILFSRLIFGSEDCLYLNVFVPIPRQKNGRNSLKSVAVFLHGGYWHTGSSQDHGEKRFMVEDIILVTLNYRLGALGFLSTGEDGVIRGNQGLKDQLMALKWVQRNIKQFGGDPKRVTIFGESVGAVSVHLHMLAEASRGLFQRAISQSGTALSFFAINPHPKCQSRALAKKFNCPMENSTEIVKCLKEIDVNALVSAHNDAMDPLDRTPETMFSPTIESIKDEHAFLTEDPRVILERGDFPKIPWITGVNAEEGFFNSAALSVNSTKLKILRENWKEAYPHYFWFKRDDKISEKIHNYYFNPKSDQQMSDEDFIDNFTHAVSDRAFYHPLSESIRLYSKHAETYVYFFSFKTFYTLTNFFRDKESYLVHPAASILFNQLWRSFQQFILGWPIFGNGSCHGDELPLLFTQPWTPYFLSMLPERDLKISKNLVGLWAAFVKSWETLTFNRTTWTHVDLRKGKPMYLRIDERSEMIEEPFTKQVEFWRSLGELRA